MDKQDTRAVLRKITSRFDRAVPVAHNLYGRRIVAADGFSLAELAEAGLEQQQAASLGIAVDTSRLNALGSNIESLRKFMKERG